MSVASDLQYAVDEAYGVYAAKMGEDLWYQSQRRLFEAGFRAGGKFALRASGELAQMGPLLSRFLAFLGGES